MAITKRTAPYEILIRLDERGAAAGAHVAEIEHVFDGSEVIASKVLAPRGLTADEVGDVIGEANAGLFEQIDALNVDLAATAKDRDDERKAKETALAEKASAEAQIEALTASAEATAESHATQVEALQARIAELENRSTVEPTGETAYAAAIQRFVDGAASAKGYGDAIACASYVASTVEAWRAEALAFVAWRDAVWLFAYSLLAQVRAGDREAPSVEELLSELPEMVWPSV
jgi:hypothetical protein